MTTTIQKWGNSCAVRLPREILRKLNLQAGHTVEIREDEGGKTISLVPAPHRAASLAQLTARITKKNQHAPTEWGGAVGKEVW